MPSASATSTGKASAMLRSLQPLTFTRLRHTARCSTPAMGSNCASCSGTSIACTAATISAGRPQARSKMAVVWWAL